MKFINDVLFLGITNIKTPYDFYNFIGPYSNEISNLLTFTILKPMLNINLYDPHTHIFTEDNVVMSEAGLGLVEGDEVKYNFFKTTVTTSLDSDPIDVTVSTGKVTNLKETVGFQENLLLFSKNSQFVLRGGDLLTPNTVSIAPITNFEFDQNINLLNSFLLHQLC